MNLAAYVMTLSLALSPCFSWFCNFAWQVSFKISLSRDRVGRAELEVSESLPPVTREASSQSVSFKYYRPKVNPPSQIATGENVSSTSLLLSSSVYTFLTITTTVGSHVANAPTTAAHS